MCEQTFTTEAKQCWKQRRVLLTGSTGFIGSALINELTQQQSQIAALVRDTAKFKSKFQTNSIRVIEGDLNNKNSILSAFDQYQPDIVFHLAGEAIQRKGKTYTSNIEGTKNILEAIQQHSPQTVLVFTSSDSVYGKGTNESFTEDSIPSPQTDYAKSKYQAENIIKQYSTQFGFSSAIARMSNVYGHGDYNFSHLIPGQILKILADEQPSLNSDGRSVFDFIYIDDIVNSLLLIGSDLLANRHPCEIFNICTGTSTSVYDTITELLKISHKNHSILLNKNTTQKSDVLRRTSPTKLKSMLGWQAQTSLSTGLKNTLKWYQNNTFES